MPLQMNLVRAPCPLCVQCDPQTAMQSYSASTLLGMHQLFVCLDELHNRFGHLNQRSRSKRGTPASSPPRVRHDSAERIPEHPLKVARDQLMKLCAQRDALNKTLEEEAARSLELSQRARDSPEKRALVEAIEQATKKPRLEQHYGSEEEGEVTGPDPLRALRRMADSMGMRVSDDVLLKAQLITAFADSVRKG